MPPSPLGAGSVLLGVGAGPAVAPAAPLMPPVVPMGMGVEAGGLPTGPAVLPDIGTVVLGASEPVPVLVVDVSVGVVVVAESTLPSSPLAQAPSARPDSRGIKDAAERVVFLVMGISGQWQGPLWRCGPD
jgi:hypothetical protein